MFRWIYEVKKVYEKYFIVKEIECLSNMCVCTYYNYKIIR